MKQWIVPISVKDGYWDATLYFAGDGYTHPNGVKFSAEALAQTLPEALSGSGIVVVGEPEELM